MANLMHFLLLLSCFLAQMSYLMVVEGGSSKNPKWKNQKTNDSKKHPLKYNPYKRKFNQNKTKPKLSPKKLTTKPKLKSKRLSPTKKPKIPKPIKKFPKPKPMDEMKIPKINPKAINPHPINLRNPSLHKVDLKPRLPKINLQPIMPKLEPILPKVVPAVHKLIPGLIPMLTNTFGKNPELPAVRGTLNVIDQCLKKQRDWANNRQALATCAVGFGKEAMGGKNGQVYVVTTEADDPLEPKPGSLRYGVIHRDPFWIIFERNMVIKLEQELMINSHKTIDGRGVKVEIGYGPCITIQNVSHVIIHGINFHDCIQGKPGQVRDTEDHFGNRLGTEGDAITIFTSSHIWIDHCFFTRGSDGLIDIVKASTAISVTNNLFTQHDKVMLLGHSNLFTDDKIMKVTIAFNHFGPGLIERIPRVRYGYAHVANNVYDKWEMYAIGGSADSTILSEGNFFLASNNPFTKQVTKRESENWQTWKWRSSKDVFNNGAYFIQSGVGSCEPGYTPNEAFPVADGSLAPSLTAGAGPMHCVLGSACT